MEEGEWGLRAVFGRLRPRAEDLPGVGGKARGAATAVVIESVLGDEEAPPPTGPGAWQPPTDCDCPAVTALAGRLEDELRAAKRTRLSCGAVLLPRGLLRRVAADAWRMAESEPCGLRGCRLFVLLDARPQQLRIGSVRADPSTECTFELYLTLRQAGGHWDFLPQFIRNLTRGGTIVISPAYTLSKKKLYRSYAAENGENICKTE